MFLRSYKGNPNDSHDGNRTPDERLLHEAEPVELGSEENVNAKVQPKGSTEKSTDSPSDASDGVKNAGPDYINQLLPYMYVWPPTITLHGPYIGNQLDSDKNYWHPGRAVIISGPTGCGKTEFVFNNLGHLNERTLIVTNRLLLKRKYRGDLAYTSGLDNDTIDEQSEQSERIGNVYLVTYHGLVSFMKKHKNPYFNRVYFDECHFLTSDAEYTNCGEGILDLIPKAFANSVRIYISATIWEVLPIILHTELTLLNAHIEIDPDSNTKQLRWNGNNITYKLWETPCYSTKMPMPLMYRMFLDYSKVDIKFFSDEKALIKLLKKTDDKTMIFVDSIAKGMNLKKELGDDNVTYLDADVARGDEKLVNELIEKEKFSSKYLVSTSVFCNGNNIKDSAVKNVVIFSIYPVEVHQMCGRRRLLGDDGFTLYLYVPKPAEIYRRFNDCQRFYDTICKIGSDQNELRNVFMQKDIRRYDRIKEVIYNTPKGYRINKLTYYALKLKMDILDFINCIITQFGTEGYYRFICSNLFGKEFASDMIFDYDNRDEKAELCKFLDLYLDKEMTKDDFIEFSQKLTDMRKKLDFISKSDNPSRSHYDSTATNHRFGEFGLPYIIEKNNDIYVLKKQSNN